MKKLKFGKIRIYFRDGKVDTIPRKKWDNYEYNGTLFIVKRCGKWVAMYNICDISAVIVNNKVVKK